MGWAPRCSQDEVEDAEPGGRAEEAARPDLVVPGAGGGAAGAGGGAGAAAEGGAAGGEGEGQGEEEQVARQEGQEAQHGRLLSLPFSFVLQ